MKKILILYTSVGLGHKFIAENIGYYLSQAGFEVRLEDIGKVQKGKFESIVTAVHQFINKHLPFLWSFLYKYGHYIILPFRVFIASFNFEKTKKLVDEFKPDLIITVQTTASAVIAYLKEKKYYSGPFGIAFSDYHLHKYWLYKQADFYLANIQEQKDEMVRLRISAEKIFVCGMTIKPKIEIDTAAVRQKLGLDLNGKIVLVGAGSLGIGFPEHLFEKLQKNVDASIVVVCGKNQKLFENLQKYHGPKFKVLGFYTPMAELYAIANVFVSKPGGLTTAEALQWHLPMIITHWLPGQEEFNCIFLAKKNLVILKPANLIWTVKQELEEGAFHRQLMSNLHMAEIVSEGKKVVFAVQKMLS